MFQTVSPQLKHVLLRATAFLWCFFLKELEYLVYNKNWKPVNESDSSEINLCTDAMAALGSAKIKALEVVTNQA